MINKKKYLDKVDELMALADKVTNSGIRNDYYPMDTAAAQEFRSSTETFIVSIYGANAPFHTNFREIMRYEYASTFVEAKGILAGIKKHIEQDWLDSTKNILSAEIFSDYLEMADYLNDDGYYIAGAVIAGTTLEERLRQLCTKFGLPISSIDSSGNTKSIKAENLNGSLAKYYTDGSSDVKLVTRNYGLRNDAAHGNWNSDDAIKKQLRIGQVKLMIGEIRLFIKSNPL